MLYLDELERQAKIATRAFERAWVAAMTAENPDGDMVWADLQASMFAAIIIERILHPNLDGIRAKSGHSKAESRAWAATRAAQLRELLGLTEDLLPDGQPMVGVAKVRHPLEHIDERFDGLILNQVVTISDFYISHGRVFQSIYDDQGGGSANFRVFVAPHGILLFDGELLDLYRLDHYLVELFVEAIPEARSSLHGRAPGRKLFGGHRLADFDPSLAEPRISQFLHHRSERGLPIPVSLGAR